jgi:four helix bundle protein
LGFELRLDPRNNMATITKFEDIEAWQKGRKLKQALYHHSKRGKFAKDFALRDQIRRAAMSVTANIAEGFERGGNREFIQFLSTSKGSCGEVQDHLYTAMDEQYIASEEFKTLYAQAAEVGRLIGGFMNYLQRSDIRGNKFRQNASR